MKKNKELKSQEGLNLVSSFAGGLSGNYAAGATSLQTANDSNWTNVNKVDKKKVKN